MSWTRKRIDHLLQLQQSKTPCSGLLETIQNPCTTCKYCHNTDNVIEYCPQLLTKMQEIRNQAVQSNVQNISPERRTEDTRIQVVTIGGAMTRGDRMNVVATPEGPWVKKAVQKPPTFDPLKERDIFQEARREFVGVEALTSRHIPVNDPIICDMPLILDSTKSSTKEVSILRGFFQSCMKSIWDQKALEELHYILNNCGHQVSGKPIEKPLIKCNIEEWVGK